MPRFHCARCTYPQRSCLCSAIKETHFRTHVVVLQHPSEVKHAKNTARLIPLVTPDAEIVVGESAEDFDGVRSRLQANAHAVVLYPTAESLPFSESMEADAIDTVIIIDGTWRKAKKIWFSNPWLHSMRVCHLNDSEPSKYLIRSTSKADGLASIEAAACALCQLGESDTGALLDAFMAMQANWPPITRKKR